jgi:hypothetical protein
VRGEFRPINTRVPGSQTGEHLPRLAACMDRLVLLRSLVGQQDEHSSFQTLTGFPMGVAGALLAGGGPRTGQVVGSTDSTAAQARDYPIHYRDVLATIYHNLGIDPHAMVYDIAGRPAPILPAEARPISKVF